MLSQWCVRARLETGRLPTAVIQGASRWQQIRFRCQQSRWRHILRISWVWHVVLVDNKGVKDDATCLAQASGEWHLRGEMGCGEDSRVLLSMTHLSLLHNFSAIPRSEVTDMSLDRNCGSTSMWYSTAETWNQQGGWVQISEWRRDLSTEAWDAPKSWAGRWASAIKEIYLQEGSVK